MAGRSDPMIENLDEFDEAQTMLTAFCQQMTEEEYEEQTSETTKKALNDLCSYLQANPEEYFRVIRKRKQEELENAGLLSFLKVKVMSLLHGEQYSACLVTPEHSMQQLNQLNTDMKKAFAYSQESKGQRFSRRIAARSSRMAEVADKENTPVQPSLQLSNGQQEAEVQDTGDRSVATGTDSEYTNMRVLRSRKKALSRSPLGFANLRPLPVMTVQPSKTTTKLSAGNMPVFSIPPPPPLPSPLLLPQHSMAEKRELHHSQSKRKHNISNAEERLCILARSPLTLVQKGGVKLPQLCAVASSGGKGGVYRNVDPKDITTPVASLPSSPSDNEFVTPESDIPVPKRHRRTHSNMSRGSTGSHCSMSSIHSELLSSNPLTRLRSTQVARSPGGTPLRPLNGSRLPSEPLHSALVSILKHKFRNTRTPSPILASSTFSSPVALSSNTSLNTTFSP